MRTRSLRLGRETSCDSAEIGLQRSELGAICVARRAYGHVERGGSCSERWKQLDPHELAKPPFETVSIHGGMLMTRHHDPNARRGKRGSEDPDIEVHGPNSLPLSNDSLNVLAPRQSLPTRKR